MAPVDAFNANLPSPLPETMVQVPRLSPSESVAAIMPLLPVTVVPVLAFSATVKV